jgi:hypothetical protein
MRWHTISLIAVGAMIALSVFFVFRPPHYSDKMVKPPSTELIEDQCAATPDRGLIPPEYTCERPRE